MLAISLCSFVHPWATAHQAACSIDACPRGMVQLGSLALEGSARIKENVAVKLTLILRADS